MHEYLQQHPDIFLPTYKEPPYLATDIFSVDMLLSDDEYDELFDAVRIQRRIGEANPWNLYPDTRVIIMLRRPVDLVQALHSDLVFHGAEPLSDIAAALAAEPERVRAAWQPPTGFPPLFFRYRHIADLASPTEAYLKDVGAERVHPIVFDDFVTNTAGVFRGVCRFLDVDPGFRPDFPVVNPRKHIRSRSLASVLRDPSHALMRTGRALLPRPLRSWIVRSLWSANVALGRREPLVPLLRTRLTREFAPIVRRLEDLLDRDLSTWRENR
jgi:hypothetical protein